MEEDVDKKRKTRRGNYRGRGRGNHQNSRNDQPRPFYNPGNQSRGRGGNRRNNHVSHHEAALAASNDRESGGHQSPMRFTLSNGEQIEVRQPQQNKPQGPKRNEKRSQARNQTSRQGDEPNQSRKNRPKNHQRRPQSRGDGQPSGQHDANSQQNGHRNGENQRKNRPNQQQTRQDREPRVQKNDEIENLANSVSNLISKRNKFMMEADQRVVLLDKIKKNKLECCICMERIKHSNSIWSCENCYNILHLKCAKEWAKTTMNKDSNAGWRCPYCQNQEAKVPQRYYCFCGRETEPQPGYGATAHSCDQPCGRSRDCGHKCPLLCHPGPCPPCVASEKLICSCGATEAFVKCGVELKCSNTCNKPLPCGAHQCQLPCHPSTTPCLPCDIKVTVPCRCGRDERDFDCEFRSVQWECNEPCGKLLDCGHHKCERVCHFGNCSPCHFTPEYVTTCHCGKQRVLEDERSTCLDPVPSCGAPCDKELPCGHNCTTICHSGRCPPCPVEISVQCRCRMDNVTVVCGDFMLDRSIAQCSRQCRSKMSCGRHTCPIICCPERGNKDPNAHICTKVCGKKLDCGNHTCENICHRGSCRRCPNVSFDELHCHCGNAVIYPPVYCGTKPPECSEKCLRRHNCSHEVLHNCHSEEECPPCPILTEKRCNCGATTRHAIPCFQENVSCGQVCQKELSCGHKCNKTCHVGSCEPEGFKCTQKCTKPRSNCDHGCGKKCHTGPCEPFEECRVIMSLDCACKRRHQRFYCLKYNQMVEHQKRAAQKTGAFFDVSLMVIDCDAECAVQERNRKIAAALEIDSPNVSTDVDIIYPESVIRMALEKPKLAVYVETNLRRMVEQVDEGDEKRIEYKLDPMNKRERLFVHELSDLYSIYSTGRDIEPNRYLLLIADRGKSKTPPNSLVKMLRKNYGAKFAPNEPLAAQLPSKRMIRDYKGL